MRNATSAVVGAQEAQLARRPARRLAHDPLDGAPGRALSSLASDVSVSGSRCVCTASTSGAAVEDRALELLGDLVRRLERHLARQLQVERQLEPAVDVARARGCGSRARPGTVSAAACARSRTPGIVERLDVHDDVAARQRPLDRLLDRVGGGVPLADRRRSTRRRSRRRRTGARRPGACAAAAARRPASTSAIAARAASSASAGARSMSTSMLLRIRRAAASEHERGDEERGDESPFG